MRRDSCAKKRWMTIGTLAGICLLLAFLDSLGLYIAQLSTDKPVSVWMALDRSLKEWLACGSVSMGVLWFCGKNRLEPGRAWPWALIHCAASLVFLAAYVALSSWLLAGEHSLQNGEVLRFDFLVKKLALHYLATTLILYWIVVL